MAGRYLREIAGEDPTLSITEVEITTQPITIWRRGIHMIPALQIGQQTLSRVYLSKLQILRFIQQAKSKTQNYV
jgi:hypothetical protein